jgi:hypothetical protein
MWEVDAPAAAFGLAGHGSAAFCTKLLHEESMARAGRNVKMVGPVPATPRCRAKATALRGFCRR